MPPALPLPRRPLLSAAGSVLLVAVAAATAQPAMADGHEVVAGGLDNPRGLSVSDTGDLFVTEAGVGGAGPCLPNPEGGDDVCFGTTGAITRISAATGEQERVVTGLPSIAAHGEGAIGPADVIATGGQKLTYTLGLGADPAVRSGAGAPEGFADFGTLAQTHWRTGSSSTLADVAGFEAEANPVHDPDSNPSGLLREGAGFVLADAGGNTLVRATKHGDVSLIATLPDQMVPAPPFLGLPPGATIPTQAVPTSVASGPDGAYYVSQLTGFPFHPGAANIYRVTPDGDVSVHASGLTNVTDLAFADDGTLYAVEIAEHGLLGGPIGALVRVEPGSGAPDVVASGLFAPYGLALSGTDAYVTTGSVLPDGGEVLRIPLS